MEQGTARQAAYQPVIAAQSLAEAMAAAAALYPETALIVSAGGATRAHRLADVHAAGLAFGSRLMREGIAAGERVAVQLPASVEWLIAAIGIAHAGAVLVPVVSIYGAKELRFILAQAGVRLIVTPRDHRGVDYQSIVAAAAPEGAALVHVVVGAPAPGAAPGVTTYAWQEMIAPGPAMPRTGRTPDDLAMLVYTSGTVAEPKGVKHSSRTLLEELDAGVAAREEMAQALSLNPWPPGHVAGALAMLRYAVVGAPMVVMDQWDAAEAARLIEAYRVTSSSFTPFHLSALIDAVERDGRDISSLKSCLVGAAPVPASLIDRCTAHGLRTFRCYGSSEHPTISIGHPDDPLEKRLATEGRLMRGIEVRFVGDDGQDVPDGEDGEIAVRGPEQFTGYYDSRLDDAAFLPGGWFRTGDVGRLDADGYLLVTDRKKDVIIRGGENISSREVEELLFAHPDVAEAAVVAAPDARMGEVVCAFVIPRPGREVTLEGLRAHFAAAGIARQKTPERLVTVAEMPRNAAGKVLKAVLRQQARSLA